jgi:hypothetical protein
MRKGERGEERDTTTHLIKNSTFIHASRVTKFSISRARVITADAHAWCVLCTCVHIACPSPRKEKSQ